MSTTPPPGWQPPPGYPPPGWQSPPRKSWPARHKVWTTVFAAVGVFVVLAVIGAAIGPPKGKPTASAGGGTTAPAVSATSAAPAPAPVPSAAGNISGSCDVSLSSSLYGQNYLTASVTATNTGNIGTIVRIKVSWPLQGFPSITKVKRIHTAAGSTKQVQFRAPVTEQQVSQFQDMQLASSNDNPCSYHADILSTFGSAS